MLHFALSHGTPSTVYHRKLGLLTIPKAVPSPFAYIVPVLGLCKLPNNPKSLGRCKFLYKFPDKTRRMLSIVASGSYILLHSESHVLRGMILVYIHNILVDLYT